VRPNLHFIDGREAKECHGAVGGTSSTSMAEFIMFKRLFKSLNGPIRFGNDSTVDTYFASSSDLADLARRMRHVEQEEHAYSLSFCGSIRPRDDASCF